MGFFSTIQSFVLCLAQPWAFLLHSLVHVPLTIRDLVAAGDYRTLFSPSGFNEAHFGTFWATVGPMIKAGAEESVIALLEGRLKSGRIHDHVVSPPLHGTVLEVGAGSGMWADVFARIAGASVDAPADGDGLRNRKGAGSGITKIYGVEPNPKSAKALRKRVIHVGLEDIYEVVPVGIESVDDPSAWDGKIEPGSVDCIVGILCMCSIPEPEEKMKLLYRLLKPGGHWYVSEHVKVFRGGPLVSLYQRFVNIFWPHLLGSCSLCRETEKSLRAAGVWQEVDLAQAPDQPSFQVVPQIMGTLTKQT